MQDLGTLGGNYSQAGAINDNGWIVGEVVASGSQYQHAFLYTNGVMRDLGIGGAGDNYSTAHSINDNGQIVGGVATNGGQYQQAYVYSGGSVQRLSGPGRRCKYYMGDQH